MVWLYSRVDVGLSKGSGGILGMKSSGGWWWRGGALIELVSRVNEGKTKLGKVNVMAFTVVGYVCWRGERLVGD